MSRVFVLAVAVAACGDNLAPPDASGFFEATPTGGVMPQVIQFGGPVLTAPVVQPIFFASAMDTATEPYIEGFLPALASSTYWPAVVDEYGVGALTVMPSIVSTDPVPTKDSDMVTYLASQLDGTHAGWPLADTKQTTYMVTLPENYGYDGACSSFAGYHSEASNGMTTGFSYAIIANCGGSDALDQVTDTISHELVEAATDPKVISAPAFETVDQEHLAWSRAAGAELADMCEWSSSETDRLVGNYLVQRIWSNAAALAGTDPCVPAAPGMYYNAAPELGQVAVGSSAVPTFGVQIPTGSAKDITFRLFSDQPGSAWDLAAIDGAELFGDEPSLEIEYGSKYSGSNGDMLTILVNRKKAAPKGGNLLFVENKPYGDNVTVSSYWWVFVE
ncbi:MAG TPA: hypothetical protein VGL61_27920 [Kofleriaceae bacterium]|jgi:hypothetical protein